MGVNKHLKSETFTWHSVLGARVLKVIELYNTSCKFSICETKGLLCIALFYVRMLWPVCMLEYQSSSWADLLLLFFNYALQALRLIVWSGLDVTTLPPGISMHVTIREHPAAEGGTVGKKCPVILPKCRLTRYI